MRTGVASTSAFKPCQMRSRASEERSGLSAPNDRAGYRPDHLQRRGGSHRYWQRVQRGRDFAAWLGLVPKQESTGDRTKLGRISKRGNKYLRTLFVQAAHVVLQRRPATAMRASWPWIQQASKRLAHRNLLAIALANKLARIAWAVLARGPDYEPRIAANAP